MSAKSKSNNKKTVARVSPIPKGFGTVTAFLVVSDGERAIDFYKKALGAKELSKNTTPDGKILHASIKIGNSILMLADEFPGALTRSPTTLGASTVGLHVYSNNVDSLWEQMISSGARITMPLENQFWGERYGQLVDPFGHHWSISQQIKMSKEEREQRQKAAMEMLSAQSNPPAPPSSEREKLDDSPAGVS